MKRFSEKKKERKEVGQNDSKRVQRKEERKVKENRKGDRKRRLLRCVCVYVCV